jgi:hypothetical protein
MSDLTNPTSPRLSMRYIEFVGGMGGTRLELNDGDLRSIGKFMILAF